MVALKGEFSSYTFPGLFVLKQSFSTESVVASNKITFDRKNKNLDKTGSVIFESVEVF